MPVNSTLDSKDVLEGPKHLLSRPVEARRLLQSAAVVWALGHAERAAVVGTFGHAESAAVVRALGHGDGTGETHFDC